MLPIDLMHSMNALCSCVALCQYWYENHIPVESCAQITKVFEGQRFMWHQKISKDTCLTYTGFKNENTDIPTFYISNQKLKLDRIQNTDILTIYISNQNLKLDVFKAIINS